MEDMKTMTVAPEEEVDAVRIWESFGYYLHSSNEVYSKDTHSELETGLFTDNVYQRTTTEVTHYVKLVFRRKTDLPNYSELVRLENEFNNVNANSMKKRK